MTSAIAQGSTYNNECSICFETLKEPLDGHFAKGKDPSIRVTHVFHSHCIVEWIERKKEEEKKGCPLCGKAILIENGRVKHGIRSSSRGEQIKWIIKSILLQAGEVAAEVAVFHAAQMIGESFDGSTDRELIQGSISVLTGATAAAAGAIARKTLAKLVEVEENLESIPYLPIAIGAYSVNENASLLTAIGTTALFLFSAESATSHPIIDQAELGALGTTLAVASTTASKSFNLFQALPFANYAIGTSLSAAAMHLKGKIALNQAKRLLGFWNDMEIPLTPRE